MSISARRYLARLRLGLASFAIGDFKRFGILARKRELDDFGAQFLVLIEGCLELGQRLLLLFRERGFAVTCDVGIGLFGFVLDYGDEYSLRLDLSLVPSIVRISVRAIRNAALA